MLPEDFPLVLTGLQLAGGMLLAVFFLFYLKRFNEKQKLAVSALALLAAASVYVVFALISRNQLLITIESIGFLLFLLLVGLAFKYSFWFVALGWIMHVIWDVGLLPAEPAPHVPSWYAWLCVGFDLVIAFYLGAKLIGNPDH